ncbi:MAG: hypothetical protein ABJD11_00025 [Gemmatimonadota bacterium]
MLGLPEWAMGVGFITFAFFSGIGVMMRLMPSSMHGKHGKLSNEQATQIEQVQHRLDDLEEAQLRVAELEERLSFTERLLAKPKDGEK